MLDLHPIRFELGADPADGDVASAVDNEPAVGAEPVSDGVGAQPLASSAGVEHQPGRPNDHAPFVIHLDLPPGRLWIRASRPPRRRGG